MQEETATASARTDRAAGCRIRHRPRTLTATPTVISAGDQVQLSWRTTDATSVSIDGIGDVPIHLA